MEISELYEIIGNFKKMELDELNTLLTTLCKNKKEKEKEYNDLVEKVYFIINELKKEIELKSFNIDSDDESSEREDSLDRELDIRLIDVYSDEE